VAVNKVMFRQQAMSQSQAVRQLVHRALADIERSRRGPGLTQESHMQCYWDSWAAHIGAVHTVNERLTAYARGLAASAAGFQAAAAAAAAAVAPVATGETLLSANWGAPSAAALAGGAPPPRSVTSLTPLATALGELAGAAGGTAGALAAALSADVVGDVDGPLGKHGDGKLASFTKLAERLPAFRAAIAVGAPVPRSLLGMTGWYWAAADDVRRAGQTLASGMSEAFKLAVDAYAEFEQAVAALMTGNTAASRKKDLVRAAAAAAAPAAAGCSLARAPSSAHLAWRHLASPRLASRPARPPSPPRPLSLSFYPPRRRARSGCLSCDSGGAAACR
jgi:hypothetical protein